LRDIFKSVKEFKKKNQAIEQYDNKTDKMDNKAQERNEADYE